MSMDEKSMLTCKLWDKLLQIRPSTSIEAGINVWTKKAAEEGNGIILYAAFELF